jgi:sec-independent protein translocase protein TatA
MIVGFLDSPSEIAILVIVVLVLFGGSQIPKLAKNLGKAQQEFKKGLEQGQKESDSESSAAKPAEEETVEQKLARLDAIDKASKEKS